ncbi:lysozyme domain-containing protein [Pseudomonas phage uligo]|uniref:Uncharacterized protein n=1 Tax=Pseudomonas phage uligo TaxID=2048979 RepID=A0A2H4P7N3_9CAUD|nr:lysozyme domain-containing protein [Pseudomonas phage uligo]ATW58194.1 hypothetical protein [Pseudomonas phage uligo]
MADERQQVGLGQVNAQRSSSVAQNAVQPTRQRGVDTTGAQIMGALSQFAGQIDEVAQMELQKSIAEDKIKQSAIAAQDTYKSQAERAGLTKDATVAGRQAYNSIVGQHDVLEANNRLVQAKQDSPDMSDEDFKKMQEKEYSPLIKQYGVDKWTLGNLTDTIAQSQAPLVRVTEGITSEYRGQKRQEALNISIQDMMGDPAADINHIVQKEIPARAAMMGVSEFTMKKMLMQTAVSRANNGDIRLIDELDKTDWSKGSAILTTGREQYQQWRAKELAPVIGDQMGTIEMKALNGEASWGSTKKQMENMNAEYPNTYSASAFASMKVRMDAAARQRAKEAKMMTQASEAMYKQDAIPLAMDNSYSQADKTKIVKQFDGWIAEKNKELISQGKTPDEANAITLQYGMNWSRANRIPLPQVKSNIEAAINYNPDDYKGQELPVYMKQSLNALKRLDKATMGVYLGNDDATFAMNFQHFSQNMDDTAAFARAKQIRDNPYRVTSEMRTSQAESVETAVDNAMTPSKLSVMGSWIGLTDPKTVPDWQRKQIASRVQADAESRLYSGGYNTDSNAQFAVESSVAQMTQTFNGTMMNAPANKLRQNMAPIDPETGKPKGAVTPEQINNAMEAYTRTLMPQLQKESGKELEDSDISFDFNSDGSMFRILDKDGEQIGGNHLTHEAGEIGRKADLEKLREMSKKGQAKRKQTQEETQEELFRTINNNPLFNTGGGDLFDTRT